MCGISGILSLKGNEIINKEEIYNMNNLIIHRGPDSEGYFFEKNIALANRRLSILDLSNIANLPFFYKDRYVLVYNGEIYNYIELRDELISIGHFFKTNSDSEVLLTAYAEWGEECVQKFNGMWAFAIWDRKNQKLFCSRDRFGIKPFYWSQNKGKFYFGSEIKQLRKQNIGKTCNKYELSLFLFSGCTNSSDNTFFEGIQSLSPGYNLIISRDGLIDIKCWYDLRNRISSFEKASDPEEFESIFQNAIRLRLRSDVDICSALSGGLDSSSIISLVSKLMNSSESTKKLTAIHAKSSDLIFDESHYAKLAAESANCKLIVLEPTYEQFLEVMSNLVYFQDEPFASKSVFMQYFVMEKAKNIGCKVMLDGQGSDEILMGYARYFLFTLLYFYSEKRLIGSLKHIILSLNNNQEINLRSILKYTIGNISSTARSGYLKERMSFLNLPIESTRNLYKDLVNAKSNPIEAQIIEIEKNSLPQILRTEDRNSMAHSIEARVPFLDFNLVEYCLKLEVSEKVKNGWTKYPLRNSNILKEDIAWRKSKMGFDAPEDKWDKNYSCSMLKKISQSKFINQIANIKQLKKSWYKLSSRERWRIFNVAIWQEINNIDF